MSDQNIQNRFNLLKEEGEGKLLSDNHESRFKERLKTVKPQQKKKGYSLLYKAVAILVLGLLIMPVIFSSGENVHPEFKKYQETKSYFTSYVEYEIGKHKEEINPENEALVLSALHEVVRLQYDYKQLEEEFIEQNYDKRILKRMIDNFRQQLDILETIDQLLESSKTTTNTDENII